MKEKDVSERVAGLELVHALEAVITAVYARQAGRPAESVDALDVSDEVKEVVKPLEAYCMAHTAGVYAATEDIVRYSDNNDYMASQYMKLMYRA